MIVDTNLKLRQTRVGIVTVTYGSADVLPDFLRSVFAPQPVDFRLYAVDNASRDGTLAALAACTDPRLIVIANKTNVGVARGNNQGIERALADGCTHVLLLNNDVEFGPELLQGLCAALEQTGADAVVPLMLYWQPSDRVWFGGGRFVWPRPYPTAHENFGRLESEISKDHRPVEYAPTCCMLLRAEVFTRVGLMDEDYFVYCDDSDFCLRMVRAGCRMDFIPTLRLYHKVSALTGQESDFSIRYLTRNTVRFVRKHYGPVSALLRIGVLTLHTVAQAVFRRATWHKTRLKFKAIREGWGLPLSGEHGAK
jgi:GT2 family glycosyltransferase